jgi:hypothetical protein
MQVFFELFFIFPCTSLTILIPQILVYQWLYGFLQTLNKKGAEEKPQRLF